MEKILVEIEDHVAIVKLNRPDKMNALDIDLFKGIIETGIQIHKNENIRAVVLTGNGKAFCAGMDLNNFMPDPNNEEMNRPLSERTYKNANLWQKAVWVWHECAVPVIAAVHGVSYGGGLQIMAGTDIKFAHPETQFSILEMRWGIVPDMGGTQLWRHNVRQDVLKELTYTHRKFNAQEARNFGFITHIDEDPLNAAKSLAHEIAQKSPSAIVMAKKLLNEAPYKNKFDGLLLESQLQDEIIKKDNQLEAVFSQMQKRTANFKPFRN